MAELNEHDSELEKIWQDDISNRRGDADNIELFLEAQVKARLADDGGRSASFVLNLDAGWGVGKTFLLQRLRRQLELKGTLVAWVNAWEDDFSDDPFLPILAAIDEAVATLKANSSPGSAKVPEFWEKVKRAAGPTLVRAVVGGANQMARRATGMGIDQLLADGTEAALTSEVLREGIKGASEGALNSLESAADAAIKGFMNEKKSTDDFRNSLAELLSNYDGIKNPLKLVVIVDELDRCRPTYAISMLERIKHLFEVNHVAFVVASNTSEMAKAVRAVYGEGFDGEQYLHRFFERTYRLSDPTYKELARRVAEGWKQNGVSFYRHDCAEIETIMSEAFKDAEFDFRSSQQCLDIVDDVISIWPRNIPIIFPMLLSCAVSQQKRVTPGFRYQDYSLFISMVSQNVVISKAAGIFTIRQFIEKLYNIYNSGTDLRALKRGTQNNDAFGEYLGEYYNYEYSQNVANNDVPMIWRYPEMVARAVRFRAD